VPPSTTIATMSPTLCFRGKEPFDFIWASSVKVDQLGSTIELPPHEVVYAQGAEADEVFLVRQGLVKLLRAQESGAETIVGLRASGWYLALEAIVLGAKYPVTAQTVTRCLLQRMSAPEFLRMLRAVPELSWEVHRMHSQEVLNQVTQLADLSTLPARDRLLGFLQMVAERVGRIQPDGTVELTLPLRHWEVAQLLSIRAPYLSDVFRDLEELRLIRRVGPSILLHAR